jgi:anti-sigma factor RsiW
VTCDEMEALLGPALDGELGAAHLAELDRHVAGCPACTAARERLDALRRSIRGASYHRLPAQGRAAIMAQLATAAGPDLRPSSSPPRRTLQRRGALAASLALALGLSSGAGFLAGRRSGGDAMESVLAAHVRGLQPGHAIDVVSADGHTVKPWFDGKVDFSPPVKDLGDAGFALIGGRLDYVDRHVAAVIVYRRRQHQIDLFVWPEASAGAATATIDGYHARSWSQDGFSFWAVSDLNESELDEFVRRWRAA